MSNKVFEAILAVLVIVMWVYIIIALLDRRDLNINIKEMPITIESLCKNGSYLELVKLPNGNAGYLVRCK